VEIMNAARRHLAENGVLPSANLLDKLFRDAGRPAGARRIRQCIADVAATAELANDR